MQLREIVPKKETLENRSRKAPFSKKHAYSDGQVSSGFTKHLC